MPIPRTVLTVLTTACLAAMSPSILPIAAGAEGIPPATEAAADTLQLDGLKLPVEILRDRWGIAHIYAQTEADLFFAQGYNAARDRLFQFEMWRRQATGTVAEILGARELKRDIGARLFRFRGDMTEELQHYHPRGESIIGAFVQGVNSYIAETERDPSLLPLEFGLLGITPGRWTPEVVISRHNALVSNLTQELSIARAVAALGETAVRETYWFQPGSPDLGLEGVVDRQLLEADILGVYNAYKSGIRFEGEGEGEGEGEFGVGERVGGQAWMLSEAELIAAGEVIGSNNWVVSGGRTATGMPFMANDPHRAQQAPSLRYYVHLVGPGWNVIGGGEPVLPGVSIGHNEHGAWGLTVFRIDSEDLYVYRTNPSNPRQYRYRDAWEDVRVERDRIPVKGREPEDVELEFTRHGPVLYRDRDRNLLVALRAAWLDTGTAPYLASLRMDQAASWPEFREACSYSRLPGENMVWADTAGNIGWQAVGVAPIRPNWSGLVPVPGDGRFEWDGYLPIPALPSIANPAKGYWVTANDNLIPRGYEHRNAVGWTWSDPYRGDRIEEVLGSGRMLTLSDMMRLQHDELSIPARTLVPLLEGLTLNGAARDARDRLLGWDHVLDRSSVPAGIYVAFENRLSRNVPERVLPPETRAQVRSVQLSRIVQWLLAPDGRFGGDPIATRDSLLAVSLEQAVSELGRDLGPAPEGWAWGQERYHHALIRHPMSAAVVPEVRAQLDVGPAPRGGYGNTPNATGNGPNQTSGASFRIVADLSDWDNSVGTNSPGQSGDPASPHYRDLFPLWADGRYFPVFYSRPKVESVTESRTVLSPPAGRHP